MRKIASIALAFWYWITKRNNQLVQYRLMYCALCPSRRWLTCGECGCVLQAKARLPEEECPLKKW